MQKHTERAPSLGFQQPQTMPPVRTSSYRPVLQGFGHQPGGMRQVEKPCLQLGCRATVSHAVPGRACSTSPPRGRTKELSSASSLSRTQADVNDFS
jgi:hypothetical protein